MSSHTELATAMSRPEFYPHRPHDVQLIQTHISYIFIAGEYVYKIKKAVDFGFLDFTSLEKRKYFCNEEVKLNRRLAPETYLGVVEICEDADGNLLIGDGGRVVEYAVKMKRLPREKMFSTLLREGKVDQSIMEPIARKLVVFHENSATGGGIDLAGGIETIRKNHDENFEQTRAYINITIPERCYHFIRSYIYRFMEVNSSLLKKRVADHRIRECHGDLHLDHICITDDIVIFDCIEFNERFRYSDVAAEVAFLAMDLDYNGYSDYADVFKDAYIRYSGDDEINTLLNFYRCYYAYVRGKVTSFKMDDEAIQGDERKKAAEVASRYFDLAYTYAARLDKPSLILVAGLMGTGKSVLSKNIAPYLGAEIIRSDVIRKEMVGISPTEHRYEGFKEGIYSDDISRKTYQKALDMAKEKLQEGRSVIIDASYRDKSERIRAAQTTDSLNAGFYVIECICPDEIIKTRLDSRLAASCDVSDGRWEIFRSQKEDFDEITEVPENSHIIIDTSLTPEENAHKAIEEISKLRRRLTF